MSFTVVVSMHRSGSSLISGLITESGLADMGRGRFKPKPNESNPKGFFEDVYFRNINDNILSFNSYDVKSWNTNIPTITANRPLRKQIKTILGQRSGDYGFKCPRTCLTWHIWEPFLPEDTQIYFIYRNPVAVAKSLNKRNGLDIETGLELWYIYNESALPIKDHFNTRFVSYEDLLAHGSEETLGISDTTNLIDRSLQRNTPEKVVGKYQELYSTLKIQNQT